MKNFLRLKNYLISKFNLTPIELGTILFLSVGIFFYVLLQIGNGFVVKNDLIQKKESEELMFDRMDSLRMDSLFAKWNQEIVETTPQGNFTTSKKEYPKKEFTKSNFKKNDSKKEYKIIKKDINTITKEELIAIKGIGEWTATKILLYKAEHGGRISTLDELQTIKGIRPELLTTIKQTLEVRP